MVRCNLSVCRSTEQDGSHEHHIEMENTEREHSPASMSDDEDDNGDVSGSTRSTVAYFFTYFSFLYFFLRKGETTETFSKSMSQLISLPLSTTMVTILIDLLGMLKIKYSKLVIISEC